MSETREGLHASEEKLLVMKPRNTGRFAHTITQEDLIELMWLSKKLTEARQSYEEQREYIRSALASGASVEPGFHEAWLETRSGGPVPRFSYSRLIVR